MTTHKNPAAVALGRLGGLANKGKPRPGQGFADPARLAMAIATRRKNKAERDAARLQEQGLTR